MAPHLCCWPSVYIGLFPAVWLGRLKKLSKRDLGWISVQKSSTSLLPMPGLPMSTAHPECVSRHTQEGPGAPGLSAPLTPAATGLEQSASVREARQAGRFPGRSYKGSLLGARQQAWISGASSSGSTRLGPEKHKDSRWAWIHCPWADVLASCLLF